jgi:PAS domain S-box-containing protein
VVLNGRKQSEVDLNAYRDPILDSINEGVFTVDTAWRITSFNRAAEHITGIDRESAIGHLCSEVFRANICESDCALRETLKTKKSTVGKTIYIVDTTGGRIPVKISAAVLRDQAGELIGGVETFQDLRQVEALQNKLRERHTFADIVGQSPAIQALFDLLPQVAESDSSVLIEGPSGTGKELFAHAIHNLSPRKNRRFVAVNCGALPDTLLESELFGYKVGAFTDARKDKDGRFALADKGTLFLDEIGDVSPAMQVRLLRVLESKTFEPLGAVDSVKTDFRVIAATNKNLDRLVAEGLFREDLYYRIHVVHLDIPSLNERRQDIPLLVDHFIDRFNRLTARDVEGLSPEVFSVLMAHDYKGNIRELQNIIEHAFVLCHAGAIQVAHLPPYLRNRPDQRTVYPGEGMTLQAAEKILITEAIRKYDGNRIRAANELGIDPSTLYRKIKKHEIEVPKIDGRHKRKIEQQTESVE